LCEAFFLLTEEILIDQAVTMTTDAMQHLERGYKAQLAGDPAGAERAYLQALEVDAGNVHALNLLGMLCVNAFRPDEAVDYISRAIAISDTDAQSHANLGLAYKDQGNTRKAVHHFQRSIKLDPGNPIVHNNLGNVLRLLEQPKAAAASYENALKLRNDFAECWSNLAAALNESEQFEPGLRAVRRALQLDPKLAQAWNNQGDILLSQAKYTEALDSYKRAVELSPKYSAAMINMARVQRDINAPDDAIETLRKVLTLEPRNPQALHVMGVLHEQMGDRESAAECFSNAISVAPEMTVAHYYLAQIKGRKSTDEELAAMQSLWNEDNLTPHNRMYLAFGLSRVSEQRRQFDRAYQYLAEGNRIKAQARPYDDVETAEYMDAIASEAEVAVKRVGKRTGSHESRPVFVLGMPRSGTSLTEQILASHSEIAGAGELSYAYDAVHRIRKMTGAAFPANMQLLSADQFDQLGQYYLSRHSDDNLASRYVIDKTPLNFQYIGLLGLALPGARFIHCHREPIANCYAIHRMPFDEKQTYAHDLAALGKYYTRYWRLMQHWKALFPERILDVSYEDTVSDIETQSRRMLAFLGLDFEEAVLEFYQTQRLVKTPSASQVREPIYRDSIAAWKTYEKYLGPLIQNLEVCSNA
jgi:tetratricopeptide (TPR) repeat protein